MVRPSHDSTPNSWFLLFWDLCSCLHLLECRALSFDVPYQWFSLVRGGSSRSLFKEFLSCKHTLFAVDIHKLGVAYFSDNSLHFIFNIRNLDLDWDRFSLISVLWRRSLFCWAQHRWGTDEGRSRLGDSWIHGVLEDAPSTSSPLRLSAVVAAHHIEPLHATGRVLGLDKMILLVLLGHGHRGLLN